MPDSVSTVVKEITLRAVDDGASAAIKGVGSTYDTVAGQIKSTNAEISTSIDGLGAKFEGLSAKARASLGDAGNSGSLVADGLTPAYAAVERLGTLFEGLGAKATSEVGLVSDAGTHLGDGFALGRDRAATALGDLETGLLSTADQVKVGVSGISDAGSQMADGFVVGKDRTATALGETLASVRTYRDALAVESAATADAWGTGSGKILGSEQDFRTSLGNTMSAVERETRVVQTQMELQAAAVAAARDKIVTDNTDIGQSYSNAGRMASAGSASERSGAVVAGSGASARSGGDPYLKSIDNAVKKISEGSLAVGGVSLYEDVQFHKAALAAAANAGMTPQQTTAMIQAVKDIFSKNPVDYKDIFASWMHAVSVYPNASPQEIRTLVRTAVEASVAVGQTGPGQIEPIADAIFRLMHTFRIAPEQSYGAANLTHRIATLGDMTMADLVSSMGRSAPIAEGLGLSLPQYGSLFDTLTKNLGAAAASSNLAQILAKVLHPSKQALTEEKQLGLTEVLSPGYVQQHGIFPGLLDLQKAVTGPNGQLDMKALGNIFPGRLGLTGAITLMKNMPEVLKLNALLGGSLGTQGALGSGISGPSIAGEYRRQIADPGNQMQIAVEKMKVAAIDMGDRLAPAAVRTANAFDRVTSVLDRFAKKHPDAATGAIEGGIGLGAGVLGLKLLNTLTFGLLGKGAGALGGLAGRGIAGAGGGLADMLGFGGLGAADIAGLGMAAAAPALAVAAPAAAVYVARKPLGDVFGAAGNMLEGRAGSTQVDERGIPHAEPGAPGLLGFLGNRIGDQFGQMGSGIGGAMAASGASIGDFFSKFGAMVHAGLEAGKREIASFFQWLGSAVHSGLSSLGSDVGSAFSGLGGAVHQSLDGAHQGLDNFAQAANAWAGGLNQKMGEAGNAFTAWRGQVGNAIGGTIADLGSIKDRFTAWLTQEKDDFLHWAQDLPTEIAHGIQSGVSSITSGLGSIKAAITAWLAQEKNDITSWASRVPADIGSAIGGAVSGIESGLGSLKTRVTTWLGTEKDVLTSWASHVPSDIGSAIGGAASGVLSGFASVKEHVTTWLATEKGDVVSWASKVPGEIGTAISTTASQVASGLGRIKDQFVTWLGSEKNDLVSWASHVPGEIGAAIGSAAGDIASGLGSVATDITTWLGKEKNDFTSWAHSIPGAIARGIESDADKIKNALVTAIEHALSAAKDAIGKAAGSLWSGLTSHLPFGIGSTSGSSSTGGGAYGLSGVGGTVSSSTAGESSLLGGRAPAADLDYLLPHGAMESVVLPGARNLAYKLVSSFYEAGIGGIEEFAGPSGNRFAFLHLSKIASPGTYHGGDVVGKTGWPTSPEFGNGVAGPGNAQLCVVYDSAGNPVALVPQSVVARGRGGGLGGVSLTQALAASSPSGGQFVSSPGAAPAAFQKEGSTDIPALYKTIQSLPAVLQQTFLPKLEKIAGEWSKDQLTYVTKTAAENTRHQQAIKAIETADEEARRHLLADAGIKDSAAKEKFLASETAALSKHAAAFKDGTTTEEKTLTSHGKTIHEEVTRHVVALNDHAARITTTLTENGKVVSESSRVETKALVDHSAAVKAIAERFGITSQQASELLDESLKHMSAQEAARILKEDELHQKHIQGLKTVLEGHVNGIHGELTALQKSIAAAQAPDKLWDVLVKSVKDTLTKDTKSMSYLAVAGSPITTTKPVYTREQVSTPGGHASLDSGGASRWESVQTGVQKTIESVGQQMETWAKEAAVSVLKTEALNTVLAASTSLIDLFGGKLSDFATQLGTIRTLWTEQILSDAVQGKAVNQTYLDNIAQVDTALKDQQTAQVGLTAIIATSEHSFSGMKAAADSLYQDTLPRWEDAMVQSGSAQNEYTGTLVKESLAQKAFGVAQDAENVIVGQLTGNLSLFDSGLKAFASKAVDAITLWATNLGRIGGDAANSGLSIVKLGQDSTQAADSLGTLPDIISGLTTATSAIEAAAETQFARTGSIDPATLSAYGNAQGQVTTATYDQYGAQLLLYRSTGDLNNYYQVLGKEISSLQQTTIPELTAKYGANSTQVSAATATLKTLQTEYTGLGDELKIMGGDTTLTGEQVAAAGQAFATFTGTGLDPAILAAQQFGAIITAGLNPQQQFNDNTQVGATAVQTLGTNALTTASDLLTLDTSIASVVGAFAAAVVNIKSSVSGSTSGNTPGGVTVGSGILNAISGSGSPGAGAGVGAALSSGTGPGTLASPTYTQHSPGSPLSSSAVASSGLPAAPSGYTWSYGTNGLSTVLIATGASLSSPQGSVIDSSGVMRIAYGSSMGNLVAGGPSPATTATATAATAPTPSTGQTVSLGGGASGYLLNGTVYQPGSQPVAGMVVQNNGTLAPYVPPTVATSPVSGNFTVNPGAGPDSFGASVTYTPTQPAATPSPAVTSSTQSGSTMFGQIMRPTTTVPTATGTGPGYRQWNALGWSLDSSDTTLKTYGIDPASFWSLDYYGQYAALQKAGILGSSTLQNSMNAGTYKGPGNPITGGYAAGTGTSTARSGTGTTGTPTPTPTPPASWDPSTSTLLPGGLLGFAQNQLPGSGTMFPGGNQSGLLPLGGSILTTPSGSDTTSQVLSLLQNILSVLKQEVGGQVKLTSDRMAQLIQQGVDIIDHPMTYTAGQSDETTFDTLTRLRPA